jgi:hypothetical protein
MFNRKIKISIYNDDNHGEVGIKLYRRQDVATSCHKRMQIGPLVGMGD